MKSLLIAAVALALPGLALAQTASPQTAPQRTATPSAGGVAAATLPNAFDGPAAAAVPTAPVQAPTAAAPVVSDAETIAAAETALKTTIAAAQSGTLNYDDMSPSLAEQMRERADTVVSLVQGFGALQGVEHRGSREGMEMFLVTFDEAATQWVIGLDAENKIVGLLFRPAETAPQAATPNAPDASND